MLWMGVGGLEGVWGRLGGEGRGGALEVPDLAVFIGERRRQLAAVGRSAVGAALRAGTEEVTRVASLRPTGGLWWSRPRRAPGPALEEEWDWDGGAEVATH